MGGEDVILPDPSIPGPNYDVFMSVSICWRGEFHRDLYAYTMHPLWTRKRQLVDAWWWHFWGKEWLYAHHMPNRGV
jgi:hypothetical protein